MERRNVVFLMLVQDFLHHSAERWPTKVALVADGQRLTYSQIDEMANRLANRLIAACLIYTSGTTGEPKGVMCDHSNVVFVSDSVIAYLRNRTEDVLLNVLPLSFSYGLYQLLMTFRFGGTLVLERSFAYPASILQRI